MTGFGPAGRARAVVLTFDNLGEASALQRGTWTAESPLGRDPSVTRALPRLLDDLDDSGLTATFFVEAVNTELNPQALHLIAARGHEVGIHGWRHEDWAQLDPAAERELLTRSTAEFDRLGLRQRAFRPPGGELTAGTAGLLRELGYGWCSPAGAGPPAIDDGLVTVPFAWALVDAYHLMERFGSLREAHGDPAAPARPAAASQRLARALRDGPEGSVQTIVLHPFLALDEAWAAEVRALLALLAQLRRSGDVWIAPGGVFARWLAGGNPSPPTPPPAPAPPGDG
jgi:peptidoglycan/xylan/chitin deacetylase (PgdA/CDA1 family)